MVDSNLCTKFGVYSLDGFGENAFYGRRTNGRLRHGISSADTRQAELINEQFFR